VKVIPLRRNPRIYSCNAYLVLGDWKRIEDVNTLVDVGTDAFLLDEIDTISTGVGKTPVEQVVLTHHHFDHAGGLQAVVARFHPRVRSFSEQRPGEDPPLEDGERIRMGDREFEVVHIPGHSQDSICLYCKEERVLFSGDTPLRIRHSGGSYAAGYVEALERMARWSVDAIYSGHDPPMIGGGTRMIQDTLRNVKRGDDDRRWKSGKGP
jgi:glyoxylase-like metal-dependent hydrolase (beta-lactamase superfamily II)